MGTKLNPGKYDCLSKAEDDEPVFVLLARDPTASMLVAAWVSLRAGDLAGAIDCMKRAAEDLSVSGKPLLPFSAEKSVEARQCSKAMWEWARSTKSEEIPPSAV